jgi:hypothetical protein
MFVEAHILDKKSAGLDFSIASSAVGTGDIRR